jgi:hypothetical protein
VIKRSTAGGSVMLVATNQHSFLLSLPVPMDIAWFSLLSSLIVLHDDCAEAKPSPASLIGFIAFPIRGSR